MAAILGAMLSGSLLANERPEGWGGLAWVKEVGSAGTLAVLASLLPADMLETGTKFHWFEMPVPDHQIYTNDGNLGSGATVLTFDDSSGNGVSNNLRIGSTMLNARTNEIVRVTADPASNTATVTVSRAFGTTAAAAILNNDVWVILASAEVDNAQSPSSIFTQPSQKDNYIQLMSEPFELGTQLAATKLRTGDMYRQMAQQRFMEFVRKTDRQLFHGQPVDGSGGNTASQTGGIRYAITTYVKNFAGAVSEADLDTEIEKGFRYGSDTKIFMAGGVALKVLGTLAKRMGQIFLEPKDTTYGLNITTYITTPGYRVQMMGNPHLKISEEAGGTAVFNDWGWLLDTAQIRRKYQEGLDMQLVQDVQATRTRGIKDEWLGTIGLQMGLELHHATWQNMTAFAVG